MQIYLHCETSHTKKLKIKKGVSGDSFQKTIWRMGFWKGICTGIPLSDSGQLGLFPRTRGATMRLWVWTLAGVSLWRPLVRVPREG